MPAAKVKSAKKPVKKAVKKAKVASKPKMKAKAPAKPKLAARPKLVAQPKVHHHVPKNESVFAKLLREKAERHAQFQKEQQGHHHGPGSAHQPMPSNHAKFARFAGPRRRAS